MKRDKIPESVAQRKVRYMSAAEPKVREPQGTIAPAPGAEPEPQNMRIAQGVAQGLPAALAGLAAEGGLAKLVAKWAETKMKSQAREKIRETYGLPNNRSHAEDLYQRLATLQFLRLDPASQAAYVEYDPTRPDINPRELRQANGAGTPIKGRYEANSDPEAVPSPDHHESHSKFRLPAAVNPFSWADRAIAWASNHADIIPDNATTLVRSIISKKAPSWAKYTPAEITEDTFSPIEKIELLNLINASGGNAITGRGYRAVNKANTGKAVYGDPKGSIRDKLGNPVSRIESTLGAASVITDPDGTRYLVDTYDFNTKSPVDANANKMYSRLSAKQGASLYTRLRSAVVEKGWSALDTDPDDIKIKTRINLNRLRDQVREFLNTEEGLAEYRKYRESMGRSVQQDSKGGDTRRDVRAAEGAGDPKRWTWKNYRWNPGAKGGQRIDPGNIKGTGIAFDKRDRAVLPESEREAYEKWMDELADPKGEWELEDGRKVKVRSELVPKNWRTNKEFDRDYDYVRAYLAGKKDPELAWRMVGPVWHDKEVRENGEVVPEGYWLHMNDVGKMPTHPTFSTDSLYAKDPKYAPLAGEWKGETYIPGKAEKEVRQDSKGDAGHMDPRELRQANGAGTPIRDRYEAMRNYERAVVKNLHPMVGPNGDNETAALFVNRSIERRNELFGEDIARYGAHAMELVNRASAYVPPAPRVDTPATGSGQGFIARAKEAAGVIRDIAGLAAGGAKKSIDMDTIHAGAANLVRPGGKSGIKEIDASLRSIPVVVNGKIDEGGRVRSMTDADRRDLGTFKSQIGYQQDSKGGDAGQGSETTVSETAVADPVPQNGPRIVINPTTFRNRKDALCVAWNERLRIWMEQQDFKPRSEPTPEQRDFFADTPYANDEVQMRRTILARIATLDTSIQEPTREQVSETLTVLRGFGETETPETRKEADDLARLTRLVDRTWSYPGSEDDLDDELTETEAEPADRRAEETGDLDDELGGMEPEPGDLDDLGGEMSEHDEDLDNITGEEI